MKHQKRYWISTENHTNSTYQKSIYTIIAAAIAHTLLLATHHCHLRITIGCMVPTSDTHYPPIAIICTSPLAARCPQAMPITHVLLSFVCHYQLHGAHKWCPSPAYHYHSCIAVSCTVPMSDAHHLYVTIICTSLLAAWCPRAMPITCTLPSFMCYCQLHSAYKWCPSPTCHHCLHVAISRTVPTSDACHPHIAVACMLLSATQCPQAMPVTCTSPLPVCCCRCGCATTVTNWVEDAKSRV